MSYLPLFKLGALTIKALSKPISKVIKKRASDIGVFRYVCINTGKFHNSVTYHFNTKVLNRNQKYRMINEEYAINKGSDMLGELVIYGIAGGLIAVEHTKNAMQKNHKKYEMEKRLQTMEKEINMLKDIIH